jgi:cytochrome c oxidase assembly protein subunit 15
MQLSTMVGLAVTGLLVASVPLAMVWMSSEVDKYRKLAWTVAFLTFDLIVFGAFTRLTDSGLGCPDWPGCYGAANPFLAHADISAAEALMPTGPVTVVKAWIEMIHRYLGMGIGFLIMALMLTATLAWRKHKRAAFHPLVPTALFLLVAVQGAFGAWTVTMKLQPVIVTTHLLLGMGLLALVTWLGMKASDEPSMVQGAVPFHPTRALRALAIASALVLALQIALGGWVSTNYATLACLDFPLCAGKLVPDMDFEHGFTLWRELGKTAAGHYLPFSALTAIHWVHRNVAFVVLAVLGFTAWRASAHAGLRRIARGIGAVLALQAASGIATIYLSFPLAIAVLHNAGAAVLVLLVTMLNYKTQYRFSAQAQARHS